jgi:hypothetical protein
MPPAILTVECAAWYKVVDMRVELQLSAPGMEDAEEAGSITANVVGVLGQSFDCPRRGLEQGGISDPLMAADEGPEWFGDGEGEHEMVPGQLPLYLFFEPLLGFVVLAAGTVAVTPRAVHDMKLMALFTVVE